MQPGNLSGSSPVLFPFSSFLARVPLAWMNLIHQKGRTTVAVAGVAFAIILIFMQLGFSGSAEATATLLYDKIADFEVVLISSQYLDMNRAGTFPIQRLYTARGMEGVESTAPLYLGFHAWRNPETRISRSILIIGFDLSDRVFRDLPDLENPHNLEMLRKPDTVMVDRRSQEEFGLVDGKLKNGETVTEMGYRKIEIVGQFTMGTGFANDGAVITSAPNFIKTFPGRFQDRISLGLIKLQPGANVDEVTAGLKHMLPADVQVLTRKTLEKQERDYWIKGKTIGVLFYFGTLVAFVIGVVFVYQIISSDISNHLPEFATLKAIGYSDFSLWIIVLQQAIFLAVLGYVPGFVITLGLYFLASHAASLPIAMTMARAFTVLLLATLMCSVSAVLVLRKVRSADPADVF